MPEWQRAVKLQQRAARVGFDWPGPAPVIDKLHEEIGEVQAEFAALADAPDDAAVRARLEDELGDVLFVCANLARRSEEHTSELQSLMRISYAVFCLKKKNLTNN